MIYRILEETRANGDVLYKIQSSHNGAVWLDVYANYATSLSQAREWKAALDSKVVVSTKVIE